MAAPKTPSEDVEKKPVQQPAQQLPTDQQLVTDQQLALARQEAEDRKRAAEQQQLETAKLPLNTVYFDFDSYILSQTTRDTLYNNAEYLLKKYKGKIKLEGHCDERGSDEYNLALGENRAKAVLNYLLTLGVPNEQLSIISYGKERPADTGSNEEAWAKNRRVEFVVDK